jgi:hypothetical protein
MQTQHFIYIFFHVVPLRKNFFLFGWAHFAPFFYFSGTLRGRTLLEQAAANGHAPAVAKLLAAGSHQV